MHHEEAIEYLQAMLHEANTTSCTLDFRVTHIHKESKSALWENALLLAIETLKEEVARNETW